MLTQGDVNSNRKVGSVLVDMRRVLGAGVTKRELDPTESDSIDFIRLDYTADVGHPSLAAVRGFPQPHDQNCEKDSDQQRF
jgi:hypothetical protein